MSLTSKESLLFPMDPRSCICMMHEERFLLTNSVLICFQHAVNLLRLPGA
jgi:hypothetical protein